MIHSLKSQRCADQNVDSCKIEIEIEATSIFTKPHLSHAISFLHLLTFIRKSEFLTL